MTPMQSPSDHDIARYVLGLDLGERGQEIQTRLAEDPRAATSALQWEWRFLSIVDALPRSEPDPVVLSGICTSLGWDAQAVLGEARQGTPGARFYNTPGKRRARHGHGLRAWCASLKDCVYPLNRRRVLILVGLAVLALVAALLIWVGLQPPPDGAMVQHTIQLPVQ